CLDRAESREIYSRPAPGDRRLQPGPNPTGERQHSNRALADVLLRVHGRDSRLNLQSAWAARKKLIEKSRFLFPFVLPWSYTLAHAGRSPTGARCASWGEFARFPESHLGEV